MSIDPTLLESLAQAVRASPDQLPLRAHLASLLLQAGRAEEALSHAQQILATAPDHLEALEVARRSSESLGQIDRARSYARLLQAISGAPPPGPTPLPPREAPAPQAPVPAQVAKASPLRLVADEGELLPGALEKPSVTLADVGGLVEVKKRLERSFLAPLKNPQLRAYFGKSLRGGLLLYGPPGCGKTFLARAVAGELGARFLSVGLTDVLDMWLGNSEKNLHALFEEARRNAPCLMFFDEIDALGRKRTLSRNSASRGDVMAQLLTELDGVANENTGLYVLAATNAPWDVDPALRRPGRFDRALPVLPPDRPARTAILELHLRGRPTDGLDLEAISRSTELFSGADLAHLCDSAAELAMEASLESGTPRPINKRDFEAARKQLTPSTRAWFDTARPFVQYANEGGTYDDLLAYMREHRLQG